MRPGVFVHTSHEQDLGALVPALSFNRIAKDPESFDTRVIHTKDHDFLRRHEGKARLRDGVTRRWRYEDLQSSTALPFMPPELMGHRGRAVVLDPTCSPSAMSASSGARGTTSTTRMPRPGWSIAPVG